MKTFRNARLSALVVVCTLSLVGCGLFGSGDPKDPSDVGTGWPDVVECAVDGVVPDIIDTVSRIFRSGTVEQSALSDNGRAELEALGKKHGYKTVACVVDKLINDWTAPGATQDPQRMGSVQRARAFLDSEGITVIDADGEQASRYRDASEAVSYAARFVPPLLYIAALDHLLGNDESAR